MPIKIGISVQRSPSPTDAELDSFFDKTYCYFGIFGVIILLFIEYLTAVLQISAVFIGVMYAHDCPADVNIPVYMVGTGCFLLVRAILKSLTTPGQRPPDLLRCLCEFLDIAEAFWMLFGTYCVFRIYTPNYSERTLSNYCNIKLYRLALLTVGLDYMHHMQFLVGSGKLALIK